MLLKVKHLFQRFIICSKEFPGNLKEFGLKIALLQFWDVLIPIGKSKTYIKALSAYVIKELASLSEAYNCGDISLPSPKVSLGKTPVWVCWWQGEDKMPPIVKACVERMRCSLPETAQLYIITWDNLQDYIELPQYIMEKFQKGLITNVHLTDILRYGLMSSYGGAWIDSTVLLSNRILENLPEYLDRMYFTQRYTGWDSCPREACRGKWCNFFFMGKQECLLFSFVYEALQMWWKKHNRIIDYVIVDYLIWAGYCGVEKIRQLIDAVPPNNENIWLLERHMGDGFDPKAFDELMQQNDFYKLSYKMKRSITTEDGQKTVYAHILEENGVVLE